jgi:hypothetical protein
MNWKGFGRSIWVISHPTPCRSAPFDARSISDFNTSYPSLLLCPIRNLKTESDYTAANKKDGHLAGSDGLLSTDHPKAFSLICTRKSEE